MKSLSTSLALFFSLCALLLAQDADTASPDDAGLKIGIHNWAGWSTSGGTWVKPEHAMQTVATAAETVRGPASRDAILPSGLVGPRCSCAPR